MLDRRLSDRSKRPVHPKDAASVVLLRGSRKDPEVLLGRRRLNARFMPGIYVFPGGRVDRADYRHATSASIQATVLKKLMRRCPTDRAKALIWAALRETWEETGLLIGQQGQIKPTGSSELHKAYTNSGQAPILNGLDYIARAITPARSPIRYDTRFFLIDGDKATGMLRQTSELEDIGWRRVSIALDSLDLMNVTNFALKEAMKLWERNVAPDADRRVARLSTRLNEKLITME